MELKGHFNFFFNPICSQCTLSLTPENIDVFAGYRKCALGTNELSTLNIFLLIFMNLLFLLHADLNRK